MLKKVLCWVLIIQHFNVYVLKASFGDIQVIFEGEAPSRSLKIKSSHASLPSKPFSSRRLKLFREVDEFGRKEEFFNQLFKVEGVRQFGVVQFDSLKERNIRVKTSHSRETIHLSLTSKGDNFSLHLYPDGRTLLQAMELSRHLDVETFGDIYVAEDIKAEKLTLTGKNIRNQGLMSVDDLSLTALGTPESVGKIINASSGRIIISGETKILEGHFENQGRILGTHGGVLDLCGNDFTNGYIGQIRSEVFKTQLTWEGQFSILNGNTFINDSDICPQHTMSSDKRLRMPSEAEACDLKIETRSFWNRNDALLKSRGRIFSSHNLEIICEEDFVNEGTVQGQHQVSLDVARALANLDLIESKHILKLKVGQLLFNAKGAQLKGEHTEIDVMGMTRNEGLISSRFFTLETGSLFNFNEINVREKGQIQEKEAGKGLYNIKGAKISSEGELMIQGQTLMNQGEEGAKGLIKAKKLQTILSHMENEGTIVVKEQGNLQANSLVNRALGTLSFVKEGIVTAQTMVNEGSIVGKILTFLVDILENYKSISGLENLFVGIKTSLVNGKNALLLSLRKLVIEGAGELLNEGQVTSKEHVKINLRQLHNHAQMISEARMDVEAQQFENAGLVIAPQLSFVVDQGSNNGPLNETIDLSNLKNLTGILALDELHLTTREAFFNRGHIFGQNRITLEGKGTFENEQRLETEGQLDSHIRKFKNSGFVRSYANLTFDSLEEGLENSGNILSLGDLKVTASHMVNNGEIDVGDATFELQKLSNLGNFSSSGSIIGTIGFFRNTGTFFSSHFLDLTLERFENAKAIQSKNRLKIVATKDSSNEGTIEASSALQIETKGEFLNHGSITSLDSLRIDSQSQFENVGKIKAETNLVYKGNGVLAQKGEFFSQGNILIRAKRLSHNDVIYAGGKFAAKVDEWFENERLVFGAKGIKIYAGAIYNSGQFETLAHLFLKSKRRTENHGTFLAKTASLVGDELVHHGVVKTDEDSTLNFRKIQTFKDSLLSSTTALYFTGDELILEGDLNARAVVDFKGRLLTNRGDIQSTVLTATLGESFTNTGFFHGLTTIKVEAQSIENSGELSSGEDLSLTARTLTNLGTLETERKLSLAIEHEGTNHKILKAKSLEIKGGAFENRSLENIRAEEVDIEVQKLTNTGGIVSETTKIVADAIENLGILSSSKNMTLKVKHLLKNVKDAVVVAGERLVADIEEVLDSEGLMYGEQGLTVEAGQIVNKGQFETLDHLSLKSKGRTENHGTFLAKTASLVGDELVHHGVIKTDEDSTLNFRKIQTFKESLLFSQSALRFTGDEFVLEGDLNAGAVVDFKGRLLTNRGDVQSAILTATLGESFTNTGFFHGLATTLEAPAVVNEGEVSSDEDLTVTVGSLTNLETLRSLKGLTLKVGHLLKNAKDAVIATGGRLVANIEELLDSEGLIYGEQGLTVEAGQIVNKGQFETLDHLSLKSKGRTENHGTFLAKTASLVGDELVHHGVVKTDEDSTLNFRKIQTFKDSLLSSTTALHFTGDEFVLEGDLNAGAVVDFKGRLLTNRGDIQSTVLTAALGESFTNIGSFYGLTTTRVETQSIENTGELSSDGDLYLTADDLTNLGTLEAERKLSLAIEHEGTNHKTLKAKSLEIKGSTFENLSTENVRAEEMDIEVKKLTNTGGILSETTKIVADAIENIGILSSSTSMVLKVRKLLKNAKDAVIATGGRLVADIQEVLDSEGLIYGEQGLTVEAGQIVNKGQFETLDHLSLKSKGRTENHGTLLAKTASLAGDELVHHGVVKTDRDSTVNFRRALTFKDSLLSSTTALHFTGDEFVLEGDLNAGAVVDFKGRLLTNRGDVQSAILTATLGESFTNTGFFHGLVTTRITAQSIENTGELSSGEDLYLTTGDLTNLGTLEAERKLSLAIGREGINRGVLKAKSLEIKGDTFSNLSPENIRAEEVDIEIQKLTNKGGILSETTKIVADVIENRGMMSTSRDMIINVRHLFKNAKDAVIIVAREFILTGTGKLENAEEADIRSEGTFVSHLPEVENAGSIRAKRGITFDHLMKELKNVGLILSEAGVEITSRSSLFNGGRAGIIEARKGPLTITAQELVNRRLINALEGLLTLNITRGENHNTFYGHVGIDLTFEDSFANHKIEAPEAKETIKLGILRSSGLIRLSGAGSFTNHAFITSDQDVQIDTDLTNHGEVHAGRHIVSITRDKQLTNEAEGVFVADGALSFTNGKSLINRGHIQGAKAAFTTMGEFKNEGALLTTTEDMTLTIQAGKNTGTIYGKQKVELSIEETLENEGQILSPKVVDVHGTGKLKNASAGTVKGDEELIIQDIHLENEGTLESSTLINLRRLRETVVNGATGRIHSLGILNLRELSVFHNFGHVQGDTGADILALSVLNRGMILSPEGSLRLACQEGVNAETGQVKAKKAIGFNAQKYFYNEGIIYADGTLALSGEGRFINHKFLKGRNKLSVELPSFTNRGEVHSEHEVAIQETREKLENTATGKISSDGILTIWNSTTFENEGEVEAGSLIEMTLSDLKNVGRIISDGGIVLTLKNGLNGAHAFITAKADVVFNLIGELTNEGEITAEKALTLSGSGAVKNKKLLHSIQDLTLTLPTLENEGEISSEQGITFKDVTTLFLNKVDGKIVSLGKLVMGGLNSFHNLGVIQGQSGVEATGL
ncbi:MAG: hypothetical protein JSR85_04340, partial [Proteobacteria bacterium]|nr:hypothetical protein [Pseudomonadota bacterium]